MRFSCISFFGWWVLFRGSALAKKAISIRKKVYDSAYNPKQNHKYVTHTRAQIWANNGFWVEFYDKGHTNDPNVLSNY